MKGLKNLVESSLYNVIYFVQDRQRNPSEFRGIFHLLMQRFVL